MMEGGLGTDLTVLVVSLAIIPAVLVLLLFCLKVRASRSNPDIYGVEGTVKKKNEDLLNSSNSEKQNLSIEDANIRTPSYDRKLPEIPDDIYKASLKEDNSSDLYATVDENLQNHLSQGANSVSVDPAHHPYAKVKKQRKQEHPYAKVGDRNTGKPEIEDEEDETEYETTENLETNGNIPGFPNSQGFPQGSSFSPWPGTAARNPSRQATPLPPEPQAAQSNQHFSGDSQDSTYSTKGYTSISVREPLENLRSAVPPSQPTIQEGNYVTLSETSDEMYAAIEDNVYMDPEGPAQGPKLNSAREDLSMMYSKIDKKKKRNERNAASYDGGYATVNKSRQSEDNFGARPKQRYSALPFSSDSRTGEDVDYSGYEVSRVDNWNPRSGMDKRKVDPGYETVPYALQHPDRFTRTSPYPNEGSEDYPDTSYFRDPGYEVLPGEKKGLDRRDPEYETLTSGVLSREPGYETLPPRFRSDSFDPGYETLSKRVEENTGPRSYPEYRYREYREPGYETVSDLRTRDPDYESVNQGPTEPGYETVPDRSQRTSLPTVIQRGEEGPLLTSKPRAAPRLKTPELSPKQDHRPNLPEVTLGAETRVSTGSPATAHVWKLSTGSEEGYETIPPVNPQNLSVEHRRSAVRDRNPGTHRREQTPGNRHQVRDDLASEAGSSNDRLDAENDIETTGVTESITTKHESASNEEINYIDEDIDEMSPSPQIHMSVLDNGSGIRRASVVRIERYEEHENKNTDSPSHIFV